MGRQVDLRIVAWTRRTQISRHFLNLSVPLNRCLFGTHTRFFFSSEWTLPSFIFTIVFKLICQLLYYLVVWHVINLSRAVLSQCLTSYSFITCYFISMSDKLSISYLLLYVTLTVWQAMHFSSTVLPHAMTSYPYLRLTFPDDDTRHTGYAAPWIPAILETTAQWLVCRNSQIMNT